MEVAADRRRLQGLEEGLNWGEGSKRQLNVLFNLWKCLSVYFYTYFCFIKHAHCNCKFIDKDAWLRQLGELAAEISTGGRKDENFYLEDANWRWYWEEKLLFKGFFWYLPGRVKFKNKKEEEREKCFVEVRGKRFGQWTNIKVQTHKSDETCLSYYSFPRQVIEEDYKQVKCFQLERNGNLCMRSRGQSTFSCHPQDSIPLGNGREAGFSGFVAYIGAGDLIKLIGDTLSVSQAQFHKSVDELLLKNQTPLQKAGSSLTSILSREALASKEIFLPQWWWSFGVSLSLWEG